MHRGVGGRERDTRMEGQLGILVGGRTELALFTAINSLPLTAYRFLLVGFLLVPDPSSDPPLRRPAPFPPVARIPRSSRQSPCFIFFSSSDTYYSATLSMADRSSMRRGSMRFAISSSCHSPCSLHTRASNLTGRFARGNLKCKTEMRANRLPRGIFCGREHPRAFRCRRWQWWYRCGALTLFDFAEAVAIDEKLIGTAMKKASGITHPVRRAKSIVIFKYYICYSFFCVFTLYRFILWFLHAALPNM